VSQRLHAVRAPRFTALAPPDLDPTTYACNDLISGLRLLEHSSASHALSPYPATHSQASTLYSTGNHNQPSPRCQRPRSLCKRLVIGPYQSAPWYSTYSRPSAAARAAFYFFCIFRRHGVADFSAAWFTILSSATVRRPSTPPLHSHLEPALLRLPFGARIEQKPPPGRFRAIFCASCRVLPCSAF
jgi:hypothetical protein